MDSDTDFDGDDCALTIKHKCLPLLFGDEDDDHGDDDDDDDGDDDEGDNDDDEYVVNIKHKWLPLVFGIQSITIWRLDNKANVRRMRYHCHHHVHHHHSHWYQHCWVGP